MTQLRKRIHRRRMKELACEIAQRVCIGISLFGLALCIFAEAAAKNPVSTLVLAIVYAILGFLLFVAGYVGYKFFTGLERRMNRHERDRLHRATQKSTA